MGVIKFLLVVLLCVPVAFLLWCCINNLMISVKKQQDKAERVRKNKDMFKDDTLSLNDKNENNQSFHRESSHTVRTIRTSRATRTSSRRSNRRKQIRKRGKA